MSMNRTVIRIKTTEGWMTIPGIRVGPLAVHRNPEGSETLALTEKQRGTGLARSWLDRFASRRFNISHVETGLRICSQPTRGACLRIARALVEGPNAEAWSAPDPTQTGATSALVKEVRAQLDLLDSARAEARPKTVVQDPGFRD